LKHSRDQSSFAQDGADRFLLEYFGDRKGIYMDIGGNHPIALSNTYLLYRLGWKGMVVDPIPRLIAKHRRFRPRDIQVNAAAGSAPSELTFYELIPSVLSTCEPSEARERLSTGEAKLLNRYTVPVMTVADLYKQHLAPSHVSLLSIDTEGHDLDVLLGVDWNQLRPEVVICEAKEDSSKRQVTDLLQTRGYRPINEIGCNLFFGLS
jgi:FkbM family methyltransferase